MNAMNRLSPDADPSRSLAVLVSGGLDSAVLLAESLPRYAAVWPLYVRFGLFWEPVELHYLHHFLEAVRAASLQPLTLLEMPVADLYGEHWSLTGVGVPAAGTPDAAVYLPGRNVLFLAKAMLWCHLHGVAELAIGGAVRVVQPYRGLHKEDVLRRGRAFPLQWTFSCMRPVDGRHCGVCNKCDERRQAFARAGYSDPTVYHRERPCSA
jgi:7-cyano-7-deazaguanine synthase